MSDELLKPDPQWADGLKPDEQGEQEEEETEPLQPEQAKADA